MDYTDRLRHLAINDARFAEDCLCGAGVDSGKLDPKTLQLVRLTALITVGALFRPTEPGPVPRSTLAPRPILDVLVGVVRIVCLPYVAAAAPKLAMALGYDTEAGLEHQSSG